MCKKKKKKNIFTKRLKVWKHAWERWCHVLNISIYWWIHLSWPAFTISFPNAKYSFSPPYCYQINFSWAPTVPGVLDLKPISTWPDASLCMWITVGGSLCVLKRIQENHRKQTRQCEHTQWFCADSLDEHLIAGAGFAPSCLIPSFLHTNKVFVCPHPP